MDGRGSRDRPVAAERRDVPVAGKRAGRRCAPGCESAHGRRAPGDRLPGGTRRRGRAQASRDGASREPKLCRRRVSRGRKAGARRSRSRVHPVRSRSRGEMTPTAVRSLAVACLLAVQPSANDGVVRSEYVFETAPFASAHASTIVETKTGLVAAWFGGTREGAPDVGIWMSRHSNGAWSPPVEAANGMQSDGTRHPCWNPVLVQAESLLLFYKVGPSPQTWWGMVRSSRDGGRTWSDARRLPERILGPIKNKMVRLADGSLLAGSSTE